MILITLLESWKLEQLWAFLYSLLPRTVNVGNWIVYARLGGLLKQISSLLGGGILLLPTLGSVPWRILCHRWSILLRPAPELLLIRWIHVNVIRVSKTREVEMNRSYSHPSHISDRAAKSLRFDDEEGYLLMEMGDVISDKIVLFAKRTTWTISMMLLRFGINLESTVNALIP